MKMNSLFILALHLIAFNSVFGAEEKTIYFVEKFEDEYYAKRWKESTFKGDEQGKFKLSAGNFFGDEHKDLGIQTSQDARFYGISAKLEEPFSNEGKTLVIQYTVKHEQSIDCGGGYIKLYPKDIDQQNLNGDTPYYIMFGPDICGPTKKVHVIFNYKGNNLLIKKEIACMDDRFTHLYTLVVNANKTYTVKIDNEKVASGHLEDDWDFLEPRKIKDPAASKPSDWEDQEMIDDPDDKKPADWDKPQFIADPAAKKPDDWDESIDGEWQPAKIDNPAYKGEWKAKKIKNPKYQGPWVHPEIDNPAYKPDDKLHVYTNIGAVGFDLWQVKSGTIFDNVLVTDSEAYAEEFAKETWGQTVEPEKASKEKYDKANPGKVDPNEKNEVKDDDDEEDDGLPEGETPPPDMNEKDEL